MILDEASWNEAVEAGHLTAEHVLARLENMAEYEFANGAELGLAPGGTSYRAFLRSLLPPEEPA
jgi:hypothetical protein